MLVMSFIQCAWSVMLASPFVIPTSQEPCQYGALPPRREALWLPMPKGDTGCRGSECDGSLSSPSREGRGDGGRRSDGTATARLDVMSTRALFRNRNRSQTATGKRRAGELSTGRLREPSACERCGAIFSRRTWRGDRPPSHDGL